MNICRGYVRDLYSNRRNTYCFADNLCIRYEGDKKPFRVRAANEKFAICTKPYNFQPQTVIYTIVDFEWNIRGMDNMIFGIYSYYSDEECEEALQALINGELEVSSKTRKHTRLEIERIVKYSNFENTGKK